MPIDSLYFTNLGPFSEIQFDFNHQVNVFTGPNNSGKSTVLWMLGELLVYPFEMPAKLHWPDISDWRIDYFDDEIRSIKGTLPVEGNEIEDAYSALGPTIFIPAQRQSTDYRSQGPTLSLDLDERLEEEFEIWAQSNPIQEHHIGEIRQAIKRAIRLSRSQEPPEFAKRRNLMLSGSYLMNDRAVIQKIVDLDYASYRSNRPTMRSVVEKAIEVASEITEGFPMRFIKVGEDEGGLYPLVSTPRGRGPINLLSQGTQSTIQWLAHFLFNFAEYYNFPADFHEKPGILIVDEIDAHLHPSWQRRIIPTLIRHFPKLQIFCSTHSPLMLAGLKEGQVQLLRLDNEHGISVSTNEEDIVGWTADEILRNFLEVSDPTDYDTARNIKNLQKLRGKKNLSSSEQEELKQLEQTVRHQLLGGPGSDQIRQFARILEQAGIDVGNDSTSTDSDWRPTD